MCGLCGILSGKNSIDALVNSISHRGPDAKGVWENKMVSLGHRRLSIIDLSETANQPMLSHDGNQVLVFNGEIYNFISLKKELENSGHSFYTHSDTEVILHAYNQWGTSAFSRFNGMFAFALYDLAINKIFLGRDHAGIKPLYYAFTENTCLFGSEIKAFKSYNQQWPANPNWPVYFLSMGCIPSPYTTLKDVFSIPKGHFLEIDFPSLNNTLHTFNQFNFSNKITDEKTALNKVRETMLQAVKRHLISDAPLGIFLSGGIDSSLLALIADYLGHDQLNTLSVTFDEATFNEEPYQNIVLSRMKPHNHSSYKVTGETFMKQLPDIFDAMDQPSYDGVNTYFISMCARQNGLKAVLSGLGGDELFGGYPSFQRITYLKYLRLLPSFIKRSSSVLPKDIWQRLAFLDVSAPMGNYLFLRGTFNPSIVSQLTNHSVNEVLDMLGSLTIPSTYTKYDGNMATDLETHIYMENQLLKDSDYMSMWHSLEIRVPFLDKELMETLWAIHPSVKFNKKAPKFLLSKAFEDILPNEIVFRKKQGFTFPFNVWLKSHFSYFDSLLPDIPLKQKLVNDFFENKVHWSKIWALIIWNKFSNES